MPLDKYDGSPLWPASYCGERATTRPSRSGWPGRLRDVASLGLASVVDSPRINALATASAPASAAFWRKRFSL